MMPDPETVERAGAVMGAAGQLLSCFGLGWLLGLLLAEVVLAVGRRLGRPPW